MRVHLIHRVRAAVCQYLRARVLALHVRQVKAVVYHQARALPVQAHHRGALARAVLDHRRVTLLALALRRHAHLRLAAQVRV